MKGCLLTPGLKALLICLESLLGGANQEKLDLGSRGSLAAISDNKTGTLSVRHA